MIARPKYYRVPSHSSPQLGWLVVAYANGQTECHCPALTQGKGEYPCWHALLVAAIASESAFKVAPEWTVRQARAGVVISQVKLVMLRVKWLREQGHPHAATLGRQAIMSYLEAMYAGPNGNERRAVRVNREQALRAQKFNEWRMFYGG